MRVPHKSDMFQISIVGNEYMKEHKGEVVATMNEAFQYAVFIDKRSSPETPAEKTYEIVEAPVDRWRMAHVLGREAISDRLIGGMLCIPTRPSSPDEKQTGIGWVFADQHIEDRAMRRVLVYEMAETVISILSDAGYQRLVTKVGTEAGAVALQKPLGIHHEPLLDDENRWVRTL